MSTGSLSDSDSRNQKLDQAILEFLRAQEDGVPLDIQELLKKHVDVADDLEAFIDQQIRFGKLTAPVRDFSALTTDTVSNTTIEEFGDYQIIGEIGRGGMGVIYEACQKGLSRRVALKMIRDSRFRTPEDLVRFQSEAEAAAALEHPNIVPVFRVGAFDGHPFFTMKLVRGGSLKEALENGPITSTESARIALAIAHAVSFAHQRGILHRDIKPANILLDTNLQGSSASGESTIEQEPDTASDSGSDDLPVPMISDFGLAKHLDQEFDHGITMTGAVLGTPSFMAPEQAAGKTTTTSADIYGVGAILYNMLTGEPPFTGNSPAEVTRKVIDQTPRRIGWKAKVDLDLETICMKCLEKDPSDRYLSAGAVAEDLESWLAGKPIRARRSGTLEQIKKWARRHPRFATLLSCSAALLILTLVGAIAFSIRLNAEVTKRGETLTQLKAQESETVAQRDTALRRLFESKFAEVSARRSSGDNGQRFGAFAAAKEAVAQLPFIKVSDKEIFELRSETAGCLGNADFMETAQWRVSDFGALRMNAFSPDLSLFINHAKIGAPVEIYETDQLQEVGSVADSTPLASFEIGTERISGFQAQFSVDCDYVAINTENQNDVLTQRVFDIVNQKVIFEEEGVTFACFGQQESEKLLATADAKHITIFRLPDLEKVVSFVNPSPSGNNQMYFSPDGKWLARCGTGGVFVIDIESGEMVWEKHAYFFGMDLDWHPDKKELAIASRTFIEVWNLETTPRLVSTFPRHTSTVYQVEYAAGGSVLAASTWGGNTRFWDAHSGEQICSFAGTLSRFSSDGLSFGFCNDLSGICEFDRGLMRRTISKADSQHVGSQPIDLDVHPNNRWVAMGEGKDVRICDLKTGQQLVDLPGRGYVRFHPDGKSLFICDRTLRRWPIREETSDDGELKLTLGPPTKIEAIDPRHSKFMMDIDPTGSHLAYIVERQGTFLVNLTDRDSEPVRMRKSPNSGNISVSAHGRRVAVGNHHSNGCQVFDGETGELLFTAPTPSHARGALNADGRLLAVTYNSTADVYDTETQQRLYSLDETDFDVAWPSSFSKDGTLLLLTLRRPRGTLIVDARTGARLVNIPGDGAAPRNARSLLTADHQLVTFREGNSMEAWDIASIRNKLSEIGLDWESNQASISNSGDSPLDVPVVEVIWDRSRYIAFEEALLKIDNSWSWSVAEKSLDDWMADSPNDPELWHAKARAKSRLGDRSAMEDAAKAIQLSGDRIDAEIYFSRAQICSELNLDFDVVSDLMAYLDLAESDAANRMKAMQLLAWELGLQGKLQQGGRDTMELAKACAAWVGNKELIQGDMLGWLQNTLQLPQGSEQLSADRILAMKTLGLVLLRAGKPKVAQTLLKGITPSTTNRYSEESFGVEFLLSVCEAKTGNRDKAKEHFENELSSVYRGGWMNMSVRSAVDWGKLRSLAEDSMKSDSKGDPSGALHWSPMELAAQANWERGSLRVQFFPQSNQFVDAASSLEDVVSTEKAVCNLFWYNRQPNGEMTLELDVDTAGKYDGRIQLVHSWDYGLFEFELNGKPVGRRFDGQADKVIFGDFVDLADIELRKGTNRLTVRNVGRSGDSRGFYFGLESIEFAPK